MKVFVQKYGGKCLANADAIKGIAETIAGRHRQHHQMVIVVSAMGDTTDELIRRAYEVSSRPNRRELDLLLTTGERVSMTLLSMALNDIGIPAISFTGSQAGVLTDDSHSQARIINIQAPRVLHALEDRRVVVLAGFQGVSPKSKEVTTLGRGGSDTTAVAMAGFLRAERCEILKDVDGVYSADPKIVSTSFVYSELPLRAMRSMCFWGAKVLHARAADLAEKLALPVYIGSALDPSRGTYLHKEIPMYEQQSILGVTSHAHVANVFLISDNLAEGLKSWQELLQSENLPMPTILIANNEQPNGSLLITNDEENLKAALSLGLKYGILRETFQMLSSVTITGFGLQTGEVLPNVLSRLTTEGIEVHRTIQGSDHLTAIVNPGQRESAVRCLHTMTLGPGIK